ncbi:alpha-glucanase [Colletotrichum higginsianum]|nr:alpha-glucanase [Colletotrichum higginsianum]
MESGTPKAMGPSWNICQHYVVTNKIDPTKPVGHGCGFLPDECRSDLESSLTKEWGIRGVEGMCSNFALEHVPLSSYGSEVLADEEGAKESDMEGFVGLVYACNEIR